MNDTLAQRPPREHVLYEDVDSFQGHDAPALLVDDHGDLHVNWHADPTHEVMLVQGDQVDGWEVPRTGCYTVGTLIAHIRRHRSQGRTG